MWAKDFIFRKTNLFVSSKGNKKTGIAVQELGLPGETPIGLRWDKLSFSNDNNFNRWKPIKYVKTLWIHNDT